jgi:hypothetical protein
LSAAPQVSDRKLNGRSLRGTAAASVKAVRKVLGPNVAMFWMVVEEWTDAKVAMFSWRSRACWMTAKSGPTTRRRQLGFCALKALFYMDHERRYVYFIQLVLQTAYTPAILYTTVPFWPLSYILHFGPLIVLLLLPTGLEILELYTLSALITQTTSGFPINFF